MASLELDDSLQHPPVLQRNLPLASRCRFGGLASPAGAGGGGQGPSELDAPVDGGVPGASSKPEAPGDGDEGIDGDEGCDIVKMSNGAGYCQRKPVDLFSLCSRRFPGPLNARSIPQTHGRIGLSPA